MAQNTPMEVEKFALFNFYLINSCIIGGSYLLASGDLTKREENTIPKKILLLFHLNGALPS